MSVPTAGNLENSALLELQLRAEQAFNGGLRGADYTPYTESAKKVLATQTANFQVLQQPEKDREATIVWANQCTDTLANVGSECSLDGQLLSTSKESFTLTYNKKTTLKTPRLAMRAQFLDQPDLVAVGLAKALKEQDENLNSAVVAAIAANGGTNVLTSPYTVSGDTTTIPPSAWTPSVMGYFTKAVKRNHIEGAYLLTADNLYLNMWNAMYDSANADGKGAAAKFGALDVVFDLDGFADNSVSSNSYLVHPDSLALVTKAYFAGVTAENAIVIDANTGRQLRYSIPSPSLPGVVYDVHYGVICSGGEFYDVWEIRCKYDVLINPTACTAGRTGILKFACA